MVMLTRLMMLTMLFLPPVPSVQSPVVLQSPTGSGLEAHCPEPEVITVIFIIIVTRPKPPSGRQGLAGSWGKDTVRQVHYKMFSMSHFAPTALSSNWILLFKCGYKNSLVITKIFYFLLSTFYFLLSK